MLRDRQGAAHSTVDVMSSVGHETYVKSDMFMSAIGHKVKVLFVYDVRDPRKSRSLRRKLYGYTQTWNTEKGEQKSFYPGLIRPENRIDQSTFIVSLETAAKIERLFKEFNVKYRKLFVLDGVSDINEIMSYCGHKSTTQNMSSVGHKQSQPIMSSTGHKNPQQQLCPIADIKPMSTPNIIQKLDELPGRQAQGYTTLGDMKRLGLIFSDLTPKELDEFEEKEIARIKEHVRKSVGDIFYRCVCGQKISQIDLFLKYRGKCPKCNRQIVKRRFEKEKQEERRCKDCPKFIRRSKGLDIGTCTITHATRHENETCNVKRGVVP